MGRLDLLQKLLPDTSWKKTKNTKTKDTFNDTVSFPSKTYKKSKKIKKR